MSSSTSEATNDGVKFASSTASVFQYGDRVKISNLNRNSNDTSTSSSSNQNSYKDPTNPRNELNGQHGYIAYEGGKILLPNGSYSIHLDRLNPVGIQIKANYIEKVVNATNTSQAKVVDCVLQDHGMLLLNILNLLKWFIANKYLKDDEANELHNIPKVSISKRIAYNKYMIENWCTKTSDSAGIYLDFYQLVYSQTNMFHPQQRIFMIQSLNNIQAMKGWYTAFQESLWFVGKDYYGHLVVPDRNRMTVYRIVALHQSSPIPSTASPNDKPTMNAMPRKYRNVTVMPWNRRLIFDMTTVTSDLSETEAPTPDLAVQLHTVVLKAIRENRIIDHFSELDELATQQQQQQQKAAPAATKKPGTEGDSNKTTGKPENSMQFHFPLN